MCTMPCPVLTSDFMLQEGLKYVGIPVEQQNKHSTKLNWKYFRTHYGTAPTVMAAIWDSLCMTDIEKSKLDERKKGQKGLKCFYGALLPVCSPKEPIRWQRILVSV